MRSDPPGRGPAFRPSPEELEALFDEGGAEALSTLREYDPAAYLLAIVKLIEAD